MGLGAAFQKLRASSSLHVAGYRNWRTHCQEERLESTSPGVRSGISVPDLGRPSQILGSAPQFVRRTSRTS